MFISKDDNEIKWFWHDQKMHSVKINMNEDPVNLKELHESAVKITEDKEDMCKNIFFLGVSQTGSTEGGWGFLLGWLLRSIKKDSPWQISHVEEKLSDDEIREHLASMMEEGAKLLREKKEDDLIKTVTPTIGGPDGTELFK